MRNYVTFGALFLVLSIGFQNCGQNLEVKDELYQNSLFVNPSFSDTQNLGNLDESRLVEGYSHVGDMVVPKELIVDGREVTTAAAKKKAAHLWPGNVLPIFFSKNINSGLRAFFMARCNEMTKEADIRCVQVSGSGLGNDQLIRVTAINDGCWSYVGEMKDRRVQDLNLELSFGCWNFRTINHEIMHAAGFIHEHARMDRDKYIQVHYNNIIPDERHNFDKVAMENQTYYDFSSIMHYPSDAFSRNGKRTISRIKAVDGSKAVQRTGDMSTRDKNGLRKSYGEARNKDHHYPTSAKFLKGHDKAGIYRTALMANPPLATVLFLKSGSTGSWKNIDGKRVSSCVEGNFRKARYGDLSTGTLKNPPMYFASFSSSKSAKHQLQVRARRNGDTAIDKCSGSGCNTHPGFHVFNWVDGKWKHIQSKTLSRSYETINLNVFNANKVLVCRGGGGHHRDNIQVQYIRQVKR